MLIREVQEGELAQCLQLQKLVWGFDRRDLVSAAMLNTCRKHGGLLLGAVVPEERMVGFVFAFPSWWENRLAQHSHMLAVLEAFRDQGIGYALKRAQYEDARSRRLALITWTFDPLEAKNAHLNLNKLGVCARRYYVNLYGERTSSELHSGLGTDRFLAEWRVGDEETEEILRRGKEEGVSWSLERVRSYPRAIEVMPGEEGLLEPVAVDLEIDASELLVEIPARIQEVKKKDLQVAMQWRLRTRQALTAYLSRGYEIGGLVKASDEFGLRTFYRVVTVQHRPERAAFDSPGQAQRSPGFRNEESDLP